VAGENGIVAVSSMWRNRRGAATHVDVAAILTVCMAGGIYVISQGKRLKNCILFRLTWYVPIEGYTTVTCLFSRVSAAAWRRSWHSDVSRILSHYICGRLIPLYLHRRSASWRWRCACVAEMPVARRNVRH